MFGKLVSIRSRAIAPCDSAPSKRRSRGPPRATHRPSFCKTRKIERILPEKLKNAHFHLFYLYSYIFHLFHLFHSFHLCFLIGRIALILKVGPLALSSEVCPIPYNTSHICLVLDLLWCGSIGSIDIARGLMVRYRRFRARYRRRFR